MLICAWVFSKSNKIWLVFLFYYSLSVPWQGYSSKVMEKLSQAIQCFILLFILILFCIEQDIRRTIPGNLRPLMTNIPASSMYSVRSGPARSRTVSVSDSPLATSSNASSEVSINNNGLCLDGIELEDDIGSERGGRSPLRGRWCSESNIPVMNSISKSNLCVFLWVLIQPDNWKRKQFPGKRNWPKSSLHVWCKAW